MATREVVAKLAVFICNHMGFFARSKRADSLPEIRRKILGTPSVSKYKYLSTFAIHILPFVLFEKIMKILFILL